MGNHLRNWWLGAIGLKPEELDSLWNLQMIMVSNSITIRSDGDGSDAQKVIGFSQFSPIKNG
jgi:hypothetical protein